MEHPQQREGSLSGRADVVGESTTFDALVHGDASQPPQSASDRPQRWRFHTGTVSVDPASVAVDRDGKRGRRRGYVVVGSVALVVLAGTVAGGVVAQSPTVVDAPQPTEPMPDDPGVLVTAPPPTPVATSSTASEAPIEPPASPAPSTTVIDRSSRSPVPVGPTISGGTPIVTSPPADAPSPSPSAPTDPAPSDPTPTTPTPTDPAPTDAPPTVPTPSLPLPTLPFPTEPPDTGLQL